MKSWTYDTIKSEDPLLSIIIIIFFRQFHLETDLRMSCVTQSNVFINTVHLIKKKKNGFINGKSNWCVIYTNNNKKFTLPKYLKLHQAVIFCVLQQYKFEVGYCDFNTTSKMLELFYCHFLLSHLFSENFKPMFYLFI